LAKVSAKVLGKAGGGANSSPLALKVQVFEFFFSPRVSFEQLDFEYDNTSKGESDQLVRLLLAKNRNDSPINPWASQGCDPHLRAASPYAELSVAATTPPVVTRNLLERLSGKCKLRISVLLSE